RARRAFAVAIVDVLPNGFVLPFSRSAKILRWLRSESWAIGPFQICRGDPDLLALLAQRSDVILPPPGGAPGVCNRASRIGRASRLGSFCQYGGPSDPFDPTAGPIGTIGTLGTAKHSFIAAARNVGGPPRSRCAARRFAGAHKFSFGMLMREPPGAWYGSNP